MIVRNYNTMIARQGIYWTWFFCRRLSDQLSLWARTKFRWTYICGVVCKLQHHKSKTSASARSTSRHMAHVDATQNSPIPGAVGLSPPK